MMYTGYDSYGYKESEAFETLAQQKKYKYSNVKNASQLKTVQKPNGEYDIAACRREGDTDLVDLVVPVVDEAPRTISSAGGLGSNSVFD